VNHPTYAPHPPEDAWAGFVCDRCSEAFEDRAQQSSEGERWLCRRCADYMHEAGERRAEQEASL
jgi:formylmethanofuran dehydrogenase subunit E